MLGIMAGMDQKDSCLVSTGKCGFYWEMAFLVSVHSALLGLHCYHAVRQSTEAPGFHALCVKVGLGSCGPFISHWKSRLISSSPVEMYCSFLEPNVNVRHT